MKFLFLFRKPYYPRISEIEKQPQVIPFSLLKDVGKLAVKFRDHPRLEDIIKLANSFMQREIHVVTLGVNTPPERIVETFERINKTGVPLSIFELLTAKLYKHHIKLRDLLMDAKQKYSSIKVIPEEYVLKVVALLRGQEVKRKNLLELDPKDFVSDWERACEALEQAYKVVTDAKNGFGFWTLKNGCLTAQ
jgi:hypothetical protein